MVLKYLIIDGLKPVLLTDMHTHAEIGNKHNVTSAGFYSTITRVASGRSDSLKIDSDAGDTDIIRNFMGL